ncbi:MAG: hydrogenase iron-sulfur subunit, partial [Desulfatitalea sp.]
ALMDNLLAFMGLEPGRVHFSWISSAESTKFAATAQRVTDAILALGPARQFIKTPIVENEKAVSA